MLSKFDEKIEKEICEYYLKRNKVTVKEMVNYFNVSSPFIKIFLKKNNIEYKFYYASKENCGNVDDLFFNKIDNEYKAYWFGFFLADGYIDNLGSIGIKLSIDDIKHLEKFKHDLKIVNNVKIYNKNSTFGKQTNCRVSFHNQQMLYDLWMLGIDLDKSNTGTIPIIEDKSLYRHMLRGYFDGNGSFGYYECKDGRITPRNLSICGSKNVLKFIEDYTKLEWNWSKRRDSNDNNRQINCDKVDQSLSFLKWIYEDSNVYLDRKYEKFLKLT